MTEKLWRWTIQQLILIVVYVGLMILLAGSSVSGLLIIFGSLTILISVIFRVAKVIRLRSLNLGQQARSETGHQSGIGIAVATMSFVIVHLMGLVFGLAFLAFMGWLAFMPSLQQ